MSIADWVDKKIICMGECGKAMNYDKYDILDLVKDYEETNGTLVCMRCKPKLEKALKPPIIWKCRGCSRTITSEEYYKNKRKAKCPGCVLNFSTYRPIYEKDIK